MRGPGGGKQTRRIYCQHCRQETVLIVKKIYDGFKPAGEERLCSACSHVFGESEEPGFVERPRGIFEGGASEERCSNCANYVTDRWTQRCSVTLREVEPHGCCRDFQKKGAQNVKEQSNRKTEEE